MKQRMPNYRIYFTVAPTTYYVISATNARLAVCRAKRVQRALRLNKRRTTPLTVAKIERLDRNRVRLLKVKK